ncbi:MAG: heavy-metal-associated domain-containing protein [Caldisericia bacterium]|nr:heavy-metal-associated domain-containing protein [Caldisericia bacterium]
MTVKLLSKEISCMHCVMHIKQGLKELGIENAEVDLATKIITLETDNLDAVLKKLEEIGYPSEVI